MDTIYLLLCSGAAKQWPEKGDVYQRKQAKAILEDIPSSTTTMNGCLDGWEWADQNSEFYHLMRTSDTFILFQCYGLTVSQR